MKNTDWDAKATEVIKGYLKKANVNYAQLADKLQTIDILETQNNLSNKINRGSFSFAFVLQILNVVGAERYFVIKEDKVDKKRCQGINKETFIERALEIHEILQRTKDDGIYHKIDEVIICLYQAIGMCDEYIECIENNESIFFPEDGVKFTEAWLGQQYDFLLKENSAMQDTIKLLNGLKSTQV